MNFGLPVTLPMFDQIRSVYCLQLFVEAISAHNSPLPNRLRKEAGVCLLVCERTRRPQRRRRARRRGKVVAVGLPANKRREEPSVAFFTAPPFLSSAPRSPPQLAPPTEAAPKQPAPPPQLCSCRKEGQQSPLPSQRCSFLTSRAEGEGICEAVTVGWE